VSQAVCDYAAREGAISNAAVLQRLLTSRMA
jgi:hypothetical protein